MSFQQGVVAQQNGRHAEAIEHYSSVISAPIRAPDFVTEAILGRSKAYAALGQVERAHTDLHQLLDQAEAPSARARVIQAFIETGGRPEDWLPRESPLETLAQFRAIPTESLSVLRKNIQSDSLTATMTATSDGVMMESDFIASAGKWKLIKIRVQDEGKPMADIPTLDPRLLMAKRGEALEELPGLVSALLTFAATSGQAFPDHLDQLDSGIRRNPEIHTWTYPETSRGLPYLFRVGLNPTLARPQTLVAAAPLPWQGLRECCDLAGRVQIMPEREFKNRAWEEGWRLPELCPRDKAPRELQQRMAEIEKAVLLASPAERNAARRELRERGRAACPWLHDWLDSPEPELRALAQQLLFHL